VVRQTPSALFSRRIGFCCYCVKSPTNSTLFALGDANSKVFFFSFPVLPGPFFALTFLAMFVLRLRPAEAASSSQVVRYVRRGFFRFPFVCLLFAAAGLIMFIRESCRALGIQAPFAGCSRAERMASISTLPAKGFRR